MINSEISVVIPAYCEAPRIAPVLRCVCESQIFSRIVVVDDGSTDETFAEARRFPVEVLRHDRNRGKGAALQTGLSRLTESDIVMFLDADLIGLTRAHLKSLIEPLVRNPELGMTIAQFVEGRLAVDLQQKWFAILNGQRALRREFIDLLPDISWTRFGIEVFLNRYAHDLSMPHSSVVWRAISHYLKEEKFGTGMGFYARMKMYKEAAATYLTYRRRISQLTDAPAGGWASVIQDGQCNVTHGPESHRAFEPAE